MTFASSRSYAKRTHTNSHAHASTHAPRTRTLAFAYSRPRSTILTPYALFPRPLSRGSGLVIACSCAVLLLTLLTASHPHRSGQLISGTSLNSTCIRTVLPYIFATAMKVDALGIGTSYLWYRPLRRDQVPACALLPSQCIADAFRVAVHRERSPLLHPCLHCRVRRHGRPATLCRRPRPPCSPPGTSPVPLRPPAQLPPRTNTLTPDKAGRARRTERHGRESHFSRPARHESDKRAGVGRVFPVGDTARVRTLRGVRGRCT